MIIAVTMWIIAIILGIADFKTKSTRWCMGLTFFAGVAGFSVFWGEDATPILTSVTVLGLTLETCEIIEAVLSAFSHYFIPYCALMFGIVYSGSLNSAEQKIAKILLLIPIALTFLFFPTHDYLLKGFERKLYYRIFAIWAVPYLLISCVLLINSYMKENIPGLKKQRYMVCLIAVPGIAFTSISTFLLGGFPIVKPWRYNIIIILYMFALFSYSLIECGVLGIKLRFEKQNFGNMINVLNSGIKILNHSLKNEITKISICMTNIRLSLVEENNGFRNIEENVEMVSASLDHLSNMMRKIQKLSMDERDFELTRNNLTEIIDQALELMAVWLKAKNIRVCKIINCDATIMGDKVYLQEVFVNLFQNAIEAMDVEGRLTIEAFLTAKGLIINVKDNGMGIPEENLPHVLEPFFTTKDMHHNFGLGLAYCYTILRRHGASLEVQSEPNTGTTISLFFQINKLI